jgi:shikimate dehydrogenase
MTDIRKISPSTQFCMVIGDPISHSLSPAIHNAAYAELGLDFVYVACRVKDVRNTMAGMRAMENFRGMSVTLPHKMEVMQYLDRIADVDRAIGAVNTVVREPQGLAGLNTDGPGALKALLDAGVELTGKSVLMLGSGGAARAIAFTLATERSLADLCLLDIDTAMVSTLAADLRSATAVSVTSNPMSDEALSTAMAVADIIVHCTPIGMHPDTGATLVPPALFRPRQVVFDVVYTPLETRLLRDAAARGLCTISGMELFVNQAVLQFEHFTGVEAPAELMRSVVMEQLTA